MTLLDSILISYAGFIARQLAAQKVLFVTVIPNETLPASFRTTLRLVGDEMIDLTREEIRERIEEHFPADPNIETEVLVVQGSPMEKLVGLANQYNIDLLLLGRKRELRGSGVISNGILRYVNCSVLLVPEHVKKKLLNILLCNDFSQFSKRAMDATLYFAARHPEDISIYSQHVIAWEEPASDSDEDEAFMAAARELALHQYNDFVRQFELSEFHLTPVFSLNKHREIAEIIHKTAQQKQADLVVVGSRGRSMQYPIMMGSLTEKLSRELVNIPLLVIKGQGDSMERWNYSESLALNRG